MNRLRTFVLVLLWLAVTGLLGYEVVQKAPETPIGPLPGSALATRADTEVQWQATTGIMPVDRFLHETEEACLYYRGLATGSLH